jgi:hypothetical protein
VPHGAPAPDRRAALDRRERLDRRVLARSARRRRSPSRRVDDAHAGAHVPLVDRRLRQLAHASATRSLTPAPALWSCTMCAATARAVRRSRSSTCGRYSSPWALSALRRGSARRSACAANTKMPVLTSLISRSRASSRPAPWSPPPAPPRRRVAHHAPVAARVLEDRARHRRRRAALAVRIASARRSPRRSPAARRRSAPPPPRSGRSRAELEHRHRRRHRAAGAVGTRSCTASSTPSGSTPRAPAAGESTTTTLPAPASSPPRAPATAPSGCRTTRAAPSASASACASPGPRRGSGRSGQHSPLDQDATQRNGIALKRIVAYTIRIEMLGRYPPDLLDILAERSMITAGRAHSQSSQRLRERA